MNNIIERIPALIKLLSEINPRYEEDGKTIGEAMILMLLLLDVLENENLRKLEKS